MPKLGATGSATKNGRNWPKTRILSDCRGAIRLTPDQNSMPAQLNRIVDALYRDSFPDINRCRQNIMYFAKGECPVFGATDETALYFVQTSAGLPLRGNGWYSQPLVEYALNENMITLLDIKWPKFVATGAS